MESSHNGNRSISSIKIITDIYYRFFKLISIQAFLTIFILYTEDFTYAHNELGML